MSGFRSVGITDTNKGRSSKPQPQPQQSSSSGMAACGESGEGSGQVYVDTCLVCNQPCYLQTSSSGKYEDRPLPSVKAALEVRQVIYKAFEIGVDPIDVVNTEDEEGCRVPDLPLCTICTFKCGQLKHIQAQLQVLEKEYQRVRREIAFSIVDIVASNSEAGPLGLSITDFNSQPHQVVLEKMREFEVDTLQQLIFESKIFKINLYLSKLLVFTRFSGQNAKNVFPKLQGSICVPLTLRESVKKVPLGIHAMDNYPNRQVCMGQFFASKFENLTVLPTEKYDQFMILMLLNHIWQFGNMVRKN